jgi:hypothetical protein
MSFEGPWACAGACGLDELGQLLAMRALCLALHLPFDRCSSKLYLSLKKKVNSTIKVKNDYSSKMKQTKQEKTCPTEKHQGSSSSVGNMP